MTDHQRALDLIEVYLRNNKVLSYYDAIKQVTSTYVKCGDIGKYSSQLNDLIYNWAPCDFHRGKNK
jgi:hypothetical protein